MSRPEWLRQFSQDNDAEFDYNTKTIARYAIQQFLAVVRDTVKDPTITKGDSEHHLELLKEMIQERLELGAAIDGALKTPGTMFVYGNRAQGEEALH